MTGLMQRIFRRRAAGPGPAEEQQTEQLPAGLDPEEATAPPTPGFRDRGRLRRRLRYLRRARELGFRDLGGLAFDLHRYGRDRPDLVQAKLDALRSVDAELRALEVALDDRRPIHELREPGIASCPRCGALHGSEANFCPSCGTGLRGPRALGEVGEGGVSRAVGEIGSLDAGRPQPPAGQPAAPPAGQPAAPPAGQPAPPPAGPATDADPSGVPSTDAPTQNLPAVGSERDAGGSPAADPPGRGDPRRWRPRRHGP